MQDEITRKVSAHLGVLPTAAEAAIIKRPPTNNLAAYDLYLRATEGTMLQTSTAGLRAEARREIVLLDQAVALDPTFMLAYVRLSNQHDNLAGVLSKV